MTKTLKNKKAFSLAEVLLTMVIVGTISALTVPTLKSHSDEAKYVAATQKAMSQIASAITNMEMEYGDAAMWNFNTQTTKDRFKKAMNTVPFPDGVNRWYRGNLASSDDVLLTYDFMTADGMAWMVHDGGYACGGGCALVDVNGPQEPNIVGIDVQGFRIGTLCGGDDNKERASDFGIYAMGNGTNDKNSVWACTSYIIKHKKMPWLRTPGASCSQYMGK